MTSLDDWAGKVPLTPAAWFAKNQKAAGEAKSYWQGRKGKYSHITMKAYQRRLQDEYKLPESFSEAAVRNAIERLP